MLVCHAPYVTITFENDEKPRATLRIIWQCLQRSVGLSYYRWERTVTARVQFCSGSNKTKCSVRFEFFTSAESLGSVRVRFL